MTTDGKEIVTPKSVKSYKFIVLITRKTVGSTSQTTGNNGMPGIAVIDIDQFPEIDTTKYTVLNLASASRAEYLLSVYYTDTNKLLCKALAYPNDTISIQGFKVFGVY